MTNVGLLFVQHFMSNIFNHSHKILRFADLLNLDFSVFVMCEKT
ncbi:hypothetical protein HMPREF3216_00625 [Gardnerella vaginalis]|uniref:Uncharacterized protein n=1 Tax=Gardnerella vaginalis TaxID=2702 RepID=A0A133NPZ0_GARVA|nr:hypothetical protein HMPREF3216_00625 [Gardnerella vaginalis]